MTKITNTQNTPPETLLAEAMAIGGSEAILASEARGQQELVNSTQLPTRVRNREVLEAWGVKFGEPLEDDPLFCDAELPAGWSKKGTSHSMWSDLVDDKGRARAGIFYKAAFYDRDAYMDTTPRFFVMRDYDHPESLGVRVGVLCEGTLIHCEVDATLTSCKLPNYWDRLDNVEAAAQKWLDTNYPDHANPVKAWDIEVKELSEKGTSESAS